MCAPSSSEKKVRASGVHTHGAPAPGVDPGRFSPGSSCCCACASEPLHVCRACGSVCRACGSAVGRAPLLRSRAHRFFSGFLEGTYCYYCTFLVTNENSGPELNSGPVSREHRQGRGTACTGQVSCLTKRRLAAYSAQDVRRSVHSDSFTCASMVLRIRCVASRTCAWSCTPLAGPKTSFHACSKHERMRDRHHGDMCAPRF